MSEERQESGSTMGRSGRDRPVIALAAVLGVALLLVACGGVLGSAVTVIYASTRGWDAVVPAYGLIVGAGAALAIGAVAGLYPAVRAARLAPTEALRSV